MVCVLDPRRNPVPKAHDCRPPLQYLINHFLDVNMTVLGMTIPVPATQELETTNAVSGTGSLGAQASECAAQHGYNPTFTLVDYYDVGDGSVFGESARRAASKVSRSQSFLTRRRLLYPCRVRRPAERRLVHSPDDRQRDHHVVVEQGRRERVRFVHRGIRRQRRRRYVEPAQWCPALGRFAEPVGDGPHGCCCCWRTARLARVNSRSHVQSPSIHHEIFLAPPALSAGHFVRTTPLTDNSPFLCIPLLLSSWTLVSSTNQSATRLHASSSAKGGHTLLSR